MAQGFQLFPVTWTAHSRTSIPLPRRSGWWGQIQRLYCPQLWWGRRCRKISWPMETFGFQRLCPFLAGGHQFLFNYTLWTSHWSLSKCICWPHNTQSSPVHFCKSNEAIVKKKHQGSKHQSLRWQAPHDCHEPGEHASKTKTCMFVTFPMCKFASSVLLLVISIITTILCRWQLIVQQ